MNRLAQSSSPYLRQHAENPVDWYPWGEEALERSQRENRPIVLSVGYSACHWCHVMAHESFENPAVAQVMNEHFINVKVDREERPDVDQLYQGVVQLMGRGGGWPLTVFLTPDLRPFYGGTYFPPEDRFGLPGFPRLLLALREAWQQRRDEVLAQAAQFKEGLEHLAVYGLDSAASDLSERDLVSAARKLEQEIDRRYGGFGAAPKFPNPMNLSMMLRAYRRSGDPALLTGVTLTCQRMAEGGIYDHLGGGFHRYSVDERWLVPHFEKMLYDNAQLLNVYSELHQLSPSPLWAKVVDETCAYVRREMTALDGGFFSAQDADSEGEEGKFFVWTPAEVERMLGKDLGDLVRTHFHITESGNFEHRTTVLEVKVTARELAQSLKLPIEHIERDLTEARRKLFAEREKRVKPGLDDKVLAGWNGLMIRGLSYAARVFGRDDCVQMAKSAADFLLAKLWDGSRLLRVYKDGQAHIDGFLEDYGDVAVGLVGLYQATFDANYLEAALAISERAVALFWDKEKTAYRVAPAGQKDLVTIPYAVHDNAYPSGASTLTEAQVALAAMTGRPELLEQAGKYLRRMRDPMARNPFAFGHLWLAADGYLDGAPEVMLVGARSLMQPFIEAVSSVFAPQVAIAGVDPAEGIPPVLAATASGREPRNGSVTAYVCRNFACEAPIDEPAALKERLARTTPV